MSNVTVIETDVETTEALAPPHRVIIHNDDTTPMDFVVMTLQSEFDRSASDAVRIMLEAHTTGAAHVMTCGRKEAERRVGRARSRSRRAGWPLAFSIEPEE